MPHISTPILRGVWPIRSCITSLTCWRVTSAPIRWPALPATWFRDTIRWCWSFTRQLHQNSRAGLRDSIDARELADVGAFGRVDVIEPVVLRGPAGARGVVAHDFA